MQVILSFYRVVYLLLFLFNLIVFSLSIPMIFSSGDNSNAILRIIEGAISLAISAVAFFLSHFALRAFINWHAGEKNIMKEYLEKVMRTLYGIAFLDILYMAHKFFFNISRKPREDILRDNPFLKSMGDLMPTFFDFLNIFLPRPVGVAALLLAFFISIWLKKSPLKDQLPKIL
ncbi:MAG: hypothetical protein KF865_02340 [Bdellovibrionaceae bacterium]|nr:hypothetical protein [Pseudobdellovibrionaceae bacterium]